MSNWAARSNYFKVKDAAAFQAWVETLPDCLLLEPNSGMDDLFGFCSTNTDDVTHAFGDAAIRSKASLVWFSSNPNGTGVWQVLPMRADDAAKYPLGSRVLFHHRKEQKVGYGTLVAVTPIVESYNVRVRREEHEIDVRRLQSDRVVTQINGKPFKTDDSAARFQKNFVLEDTHGIKATDGGFVLECFAPANRPSAIKVVAERLSNDLETLRQEAAFARACMMGVSAGDKRAAN